MKYFVKKDTKFIKKEFNKNNPDENIFKENIKKNFNGEKANPDENIFKKYIDDEKWKVPDEKICCHRCGTETGLTEKGLRYYCVMEDICCVRCGVVIIKARKVWC